ncbi:hypothetical protein [Clostridium beijerinckii]|uniref:hypothetical protein n=1 Tax=Clostridium beijerinckii TaxID=1520 RepID=UPI00056D419D|nr:hypothetical protein [Clostridium beijerinckii]
MSKELNLIEAMKMPIGTRFNFKGDFDFESGFIEVIKGNDKDNLLCWDGDICQQVNVTTATSNMTLTPIQQPVNFMEVVNSDKKCKVEHKLMICHFDEYEFDLKVYRFLSDIMQTLGHIHTSMELRKIIKEGKWYVEE